MIKLFKYTHIFENGKESISFINPEELEAITMKNSLYILHLKSGKQFTLSHPDFLAFCKLSKVKIFTSEMGLSPNLEGVA